MISVYHLYFFKFQVRNTIIDTETLFMTTTAQSVAVQKQSTVWTYFERIKTDERLKAKCLIDGCGKVLATPLHSTSTLIRHLRYVHKLNGFKGKEELANRSPIKKLSLQLKKKLDDAVMAAIIEDGRSFSDFSKAGFIKLIQLAVPSKKHTYSYHLFSMLIYILFRLYHTSS